MTEHPTELLLQIADGATPPPEARAHLTTCQRCQQTLAALEIAPSFERAQDLLLKISENK